MSLKQKYLLCRWGWLIKVRKSKEVFYTTVIEVRAVTDAEKHALVVLFSNTTFLQYY